MRAQEIWKWQLEITGEQTISVPTGAVFLCVQFQRGALCVWALVQPDYPREDVTVSVVGTGHAVSANTGPYLGTAQQVGGRLVWHVFMRRG